MKGLGDSMIYEFKECWNINRVTNLAITDPMYFEDATPILEVNNGCDSLYKVYDEYKKEGEDIVGTFGVDSATVGVLKLRDMKDKEMLKKEHLYTVIPKFKGTIALFTNDEEEWKTEYLLKFDGYSNGERIEWVAVF